MEALHQQQLRMTLPTFVTLTHTYRKNFTIKISELVLSGHFRSQRSHVSLYNRSRANLSIASYSRRAKGVFSSQTLFHTTYHFRDIGVQSHPLISGAPRKFDVFRLPSQRWLMRYRLHIWQLGRANGIVASELLWMTSTYFCDIDTHLKENLSRLSQVQRRYRAQSYSSEWS